MYYDEKSACCVSVLFTNTSIKFMCRVHCQEAIMSYGMKFYRLHISAKQIMIRLISVVPTPAVTPMLLSKGKTMVQLTKKDKSTINRDLSSIKDGGKVGPCPSHLENITTTRRGCCICCFIVNLMISENCHNHDLTFSDKMKQSHYILLSGTLKNTTHYECNDI